MVRGHNSVTWRHRCLGLIALLAGAAPPLPAQSPADRQTLAAWDDSLVHAPSSANLRRFSPEGARKTDASPLRELLWRTRMAEIRKDNGDLERALGGLLLEQARHPAWPWPSLALARTFEWMHHQGMTVGGWSGAIEGETLADAAWRHMATMMAVDPDFDRGRDYYFGKIVAQGDRELHQEQLGPLQVELRRPHPDARALLAWGRAVRGQARYDSALALFDRAGEAGEDPSRLALERARTLRALGDTMAARVAYWSGLERFSGVGRASYRYDLQWILDADSLAVFDAVRDSDLAGWMHRFWDERDASAANYFGERLQEHLARWVNAVVLFRVSTPWRRTEVRRMESAWDGTRPCLLDDSPSYERLWDPQPSYPGDLRDAERLFDPRGVIYLRHGTPLRVMSASAPSPAGAAAPPVRIEEQMRSGASWLYWLDGGYQLLTVRGSAALGPLGATPLGRSLPARGPRWFPGHPSNGMSGSGMTEGMAPGGGGPVPEEIRACGVVVPSPVAPAPRSRREAIDSDSDLPPLVDAWSGAFRTYALGPGAAAGGRIVVTFAIPGTRLQPEFTADRKPVWPLRFRIVAYQPRTGRRVELDTLGRFEVPPARGTQGFLTGWLELPLGAGDWQVAVRAQQAGDSAGMFGLQRHVVVSDSPSLSLSDLMRGVDGAHLWTAPDRRGFPLNTMGTWTPETPMDLYYEVYGLPHGQSYRTTIQIRPADTLSRKHIDMTSTEMSSGPVTPVRKVLVLEKLTPGAYTLVVNVSSGKMSTERRVVFDVLRP